MASNVVLKIKYDDSKKHNYLTGYRLYVPETWMCYYHSWMKDYDYNYESTSYEYHFTSILDDERSYTWDRSFKSKTTLFLNDEKTISTIWKTVRLIAQTKPNNYYNEDAIGGTEYRYYGENEYTTSNCSAVAEYSSSKAPFEVCFLKTGHVNTAEQVLSCATVHKDGVAAQYEWTAATVYYKKTSEATYSSVEATVSGDWSNVQVKSNASLTAGEYDVYVVAASDDGQTAQTEVGKFSTQDAEAVARCVSPSGTVESEAVTFTWSHSTEYGEKQLAYDLQYRMNDDTSWKTLGSHVKTSDTSYAYSISTSGIVHWRVRTYNQSDVAGDWSETSYINNTPAQAPTNVSAAGTGRADVTWTSSTQSAFQLVVESQSGSVLFDSKVVFTQKTEYLVNDYFVWNPIKIKIRVANAIGNWSDWESTWFNATESEEGDFTAIDTGKGILLTINDKHKHSHIHILRNGALVKSLSTEKEWTDVRASGETKYTLIFVDDTGARSIVTKEVEAQFKNPSIILNNGEIIGVDVTIGSSGRVSTSSEADVGKYEFFGDSAVSHYPGKLRRKTVSVAFFDEDNVAEDILGQTLYFNNGMGSAGWYCVTQYTEEDEYTRHKGKYVNQVTLTLEKTNHNDEIKYEA